MFENILHISSIFEYRAGNFGKRIRLRELNSKNFSKKYTLIVFCESSTFLAENGLHCYIYKNELVKLLIVPC